MAPARDHSSISRADFSPGPAPPSPLQFSYHYRGCTNAAAAAVKLQDSTILAQPPLNHPLGRLSSPTNYTGGLLSLGSHSILSFKALSESSSSNSSMLSFEQDNLKGPTAGKPGGSGGRRRSRDELLRDLQLLRAGGGDCEGEPERGGIRGAEGMGSKRHCATTHSKSKSKVTTCKDPQSVAAKNRRERISERLKILQDLVPNGTKVDLVTMLEKAISYVKFLQLQVKVLATDEFWPPDGGKAPELAQVKEAIDAILASHNGSSS
ncbi:unnamed protein product [Spirodela intermedia]|uniref:BHLH domain-containing protein n=1 Tax=Spirodela intermedia TaxID=51605 RepID=A0A7I8JU21_SPIIN|nr:unnamed protein product [Spirodela intermedia]CAA6673113.1 unnamed protein product [Spirodela intermedia]